MIFLLSRDFPAYTLISKMGVKMNFRILTKNHEDDSEKGFPAKSISKPYGRATAMPPARELTNSDHKRRLPKKLKTSLF